MSDRILTYALEDRFFRRRLEQILAEHKIDTIVETGLDQGLSAIELARLVPTYIGIDIDPACVARTSAEMDAARIANCKLFVGNSADTLPSIMDRIDPARALFFLDAHCFGDTDCPIIEEINAIPRRQGVLVFHDIWAPGREHGGFSPLIAGKPARFDYGLLQPALAAWSRTHRVEYLAEYESTRAPGVMFAFPE